MNISASKSNAVPVTSQPLSATKVPTQTLQDIAPKSKSAMDTFTQTVVSAQAGASATAVIAGVGAGVMTYRGLSDAGPVHRALFTTFGTLGGAAAGAVAGGLGAVVAGAVSDTKSNGAMVGGATGAISGAAAGAAISLKSGKGLDIKAVAAMAVAGAALGAIGGFAGVAAKQAIQ
jgi:hypothetical protein